MLYQDKETFYGSIKRMLCPRQKHTIHFVVALKEWHVLGRKFFAIVRNSKECHFEGKKTFHGGTKIVPGSG